MAEGDRSREPGNAPVHRSRRRRLSDVDITLTEAAYAHVQSAYIEGNESELPKIKSELASVTFQLPPVLKDGLRHDVQEFVNSSLLDRYYTRALEQSKAINWMQTSAKFVCLNTEGDGNCLMHGASLAMWGIQDRKLLLRRAVHTALRRDPQGRLRQRWKRAREAADGQLEFSLRLEDRQWEDEWRCHVVELSSCRTKTMGLLYESLEEFHVFVLAQVLCRPIIVLADRTLPSVGGEQLSPVNIAGIYLPVERSRKDCIRSPIVLAYSAGHFCALAVLSGEPVVPLCFHSRERLPIRFLLEGEERSVENLLEQRLDKTVLQLIPEDPLVSFVPIDAVRIAAPAIRPRVLTSLGKTYEQQLDHLFLEDQAAKCRTEGCNNYHVGSREFCATCLRKNDRPGFQTQRSGGSNPCQGMANCPNTVETGARLCRDCREQQQTSSPLNAALSGVGSTDPQQSKTCTTDTCTYHGSPEYNGMCSTCFRIYTMQQAKSKPSSANGNSSTVVHAPPEKQCLHEGCTRPGSQDVLSFCEEHFVERAAVQANRRSRENERTSASTAQSGQGRATLLEVSGAAQRRGNAQRSGAQQCRTPGCSHTDLKWGNFCEVCLQSMSDAWLEQRYATANHALPPPASSSTVGKAPLASGQRGLLKKCATAGCPFEAVEPQVLCQACLHKCEEAQKRQRASERSVTRTRLLACSRCNTMCSAENLRVSGGLCEQCVEEMGARIDCKTPGCTFYGTSQYDWYCSQCYDRHLREKEAQHIREQQNAALRDHQRLQQHYSSLQASASSYLQSCAVCGVRSATLGECGICNACAQEAIRLEGSRQHGHLAGSAVH